MKTLITDWKGKTSNVSFCSVATETQCIRIAGQVLVPNEDNAYVEFFMSHAYPVQTKYRTGIHPAVVANSYLTLNHKVFNLAHLMRKYNPEENPRDRILGTVVAVEYAPDIITCGCGCCFNFSAQPLTDGKVKCLDCDELFSSPVYVVGPLDAAPGIRAVAVMHKAAESVMDILTSWFTGQKPNGGEWTVSMENSFYDEEGGFLVHADNTQSAAMEPFAASTPADLLALGYVYVPYSGAPKKLIGCMNNESDDRRDGVVSARVCRDFEGQEVIFLLGGLNGKIRYRGVGLTPSDGARESEARVSQMLASAPMIDVQEAFDSLTELGEKAVALVVKK